MTTNYINDKNGNVEDLDKLKHLKSTSTDMMPEFLAASQKLFSDERISNNNNYDAVSLDENIDDLISKKKEPKKFDTEKNSNFNKHDKKPKHEKHEKPEKHEKDERIPEKSEEKNKEKEQKKDVARSEKKEDNIHRSEKANIDNNKNDHTNKYDNYDLHRKNFSETETEMDKDKPQSKEELMLEKLDMLRKLAELHHLGVTLTQKYNLDSDLKMMKFEYDLHKNIRAKKNSINWMNNILLNMVYGIEMLNEKYNPFDLKLKGWAEQMNAETDNYYDVFGELYEKYSKPGEGMMPELKLLLMFSGSALKYHLQNNIMNLLPSLNADLEKNRELTNEYRQKAIAEKIIEKTNEQNNKINDKTNKEHNEACNKVNDLKFMQKKEVEYLESQKKLSENNKNSHTLEEPVVSQNLKNILSTIPRSNNTNNKSEKQSENGPTEKELLEQQIQTLKKALEIQSLQLKQAQHQIQTLINQHQIIRQNQQYTNVQNQEPVQNHTNQHVYAPQHHIQNTQQVYQAKQMVAHHEQTKQTEQAQKSQKSQNDNLSKKSKHKKENKDSQECNYNASNKSDGSNSDEDSRSYDSKYSYSSNNSRYRKRSEKSLRHRSKRSTRSNGSDLRINPNIKSIFKTKIEVQEELKQKRDLKPSEKIIPMDTIDRNEVMSLNSKRIHNQNKLSQHRN
jgi:AAA ATPase containing von Willebrand factor type A (vWA) domain